ncbi:MAG TPA: amino acid ABC transporter permease [Thermoleophilaceae bacterium]|nr:amino acid ABC transporter permease [Thermoleophilaceae bacterium]
MNDQASGLEVFFEQYFNIPLLLEDDNYLGVLEGFLETIQLSLVSGVLALIWGLILAVLRQTPGRFGAILRVPVIAYIDGFRGIPVLLVIILISGSLPPLAEGLGLPREIGIPQWLGKPDPFWYGVFAITLTYGAYMAEVYRAGIEAVPSGQMEAARSLGMGHAAAMRHVIVPQAVRKVIPPLLNDFVALMKDTSLVSVLGFVEVVQAGSDVQQATFNSTALVFGAVLFLIVTIPLARLVDYMLAGQQKRVSRTAPA